MILMIDNYDSFTYNIVQYLGELGATVDVRRNDEISLDEIQQLEPEKIVISPGPCTPNEAGISMEVVRTFGQSIPILGICLGHQSIGQSYGGEVVRARQVMHGKLSKVTLEVTEEDTPSSIALDLVEELELEPSAETLQTVVAQVEAAMDNQGATPAQQEWDAV